MKRIMLLGILLLTVNCWANAPASMQLFKTTIQVSGDLSIDKLRMQNLTVVKEAVIGIKKTLPQKVDAYTQMVDVDSHGTELIYTFEINAGPKSDATLKVDGQTRMAPVIRRGICKDSKRFLQSDIIITYRYLNKTTQNEILKITMDKKACGL
ncbi:MAG TPA: hypothetical protein ENK39_05505 [Epsilonproteobacteria bacterium]|nr:hypothetical protein [Campylobacterota bacterium]